jgi:hypothetical protein
MSLTMTTVVATARGGLERLTRRRLPRRIA